ncbi:hypothetical protein B296_00008450 [Ensete ventricosum]|uniref:Uncharacterized protein n=1 Tax=Ensete ventricosum TaxID=4639 RepID=A0A426Z8B9_ENSVE|nr:hypothetical protein B296_00008450 [Ensete ventricosum]
MAEEPIVLSFNSGRNCTRSDNRRKLRGSSDLSVNNRGRLDPLHLRWRQQQKASTVEAEAALGLVQGHVGVKQGSPYRYIPAYRAHLGTKQYADIERYAQAYRSIYIYIHKQS